MVLKLTLFGARLGIWTALIIVILTLIIVKINNRNVKIIPTSVKITTTSVKITQNVNYTVLCFTDAATCYVVFFFPIFLVPSPDEI